MNENKVALRFKDEWLPDYLPVRYPHDTEEEVIKKIEDYRDRRDSELREYERILAETGDEDEELLLSDVGLDMRGIRLIGRWKNGASGSAKRRNRHADSWRLPKGREVGGRR